ncbi:MAG TPA: hypothetical protein VFZ83_02295 [Acidimicrobiia bacterium]|nr:hypothetical protein [Acidimicrobiia bacterium]
MGAEASERRLLRAVERRLEPDEVVRAWSRAWVSPVRTVQWLAPRHRDFVVVTDRRLMLWAAGFWSRRPRRRVLTERLDEIGIAPGRGASVRITPPERKPILLELGTTPGAVAVRDALTAATPVGDA